MTLPAFQLTEPLVTAMVALLGGNLNTTIDQLNATVTDGYTVPHVVDFYPFVPVPSNLQAGIPAVGVQRIESVFEDDQQFWTNALHTYAVVAICQHVDQQTLAWQLDRMLQAILYTIQADRLAGTASGSGGIMRSQGGAQSVNLIRTEPGPLLGDLDPTSPESPPRSYLSWTAVVLQSVRSEQVQ